MIEKNSIYCKIRYKRGNIIAIYKVPKNLIKAKGKRVKLPSPKKKKSITYGVC